jgi:hypothetical protein
MHLFDSLREYCAIKRDISSQKEMYQLTFQDSETMCVVRMRIGGDYGAHIILTNMHIFPAYARGNGFGSHTIQLLLSHAIAVGMEEIHAIRIQKEAIPFWKRNGFVPLKDTWRSYAYRGALLDI